MRLRTAAAAALQTAAVLREMRTPHRCYLLSQAGPNLEALVLLLWTEVRHPMGPFSHRETGVIL